MFINCLFAWRMAGIILYPRPYKTAGKVKRGYYVNKQARGDRGCRLVVKQSVARTISFLSHGAIQMQ